MSPKPRLIAIDVDGTLIDSRTRINPEVAASVKVAIEDGAMVALATGRMISAAKQYIDELGIDKPVVALNGSFVGWPGEEREPIYSEPISKESAQKLIELSWDAGVTLISVCCERAFARNITEITSPALASWIVNISPFEKFNSYNGGMPSAILVAGGKDEVTSLHDMIKSLKLSDIDKYFFPSIRYFPMHYLEIRAKGTNKGRGLEMLAKHLGVTHDEILAIGDYLNDLPMAKVANIFAVPSNAHPEALAIADYISPLTNDEGAVAEILDTHYFAFRP